MKSAENTVRPFVTFVNLTEQELSRFWSKVPNRPPGDCWLWCSSIGSNGYGYFSVKGVAFGAHRLSFMIAYGEIPDGRLVVCHRCDTPKCVNPAHLFITTVAGNSRDMIEKGRSARGEKSPPKKYPENYRGEKNGSAIFKDSDVSLWRSKFMTRDEILEIAHSLGTKAMNIKNAIYGKTYSHLPPSEFNIRKLMPRGMYRKGENNVLSLLKEEDVIRLRVTKPTRTKLRLEAERLGVAHSTLYNAIKGESWKHLPMP